MNHTQPDQQFDADGKALGGPTCQVQVVYEPDLKSNPPAAPTPDIRRADDPKRIGIPSDQREPRGRPAPNRESRPKQTQISESALERHARKCVICNHPDREEIEELFLHWNKPAWFAPDFNVTSRALYRHAHATGLYEARQGNLRCVLDRILERSGEATLTGESIIRAVRAYTCLTSENQWVEPPSRVIFSSQPLPAPARHGDGLPASIAVSPRLPAQSGEEILVREDPELIDTVAIRK
jgi:hypothetical protein